MKQEQPPEDRRVQIEFNDIEHMRAIVGQNGVNLKTIERRTGARVTHRGNMLTVGGGEAEVALVKNLLDQLSNLLAGGYPLYPGDVEQAIKILAGHAKVDLKDIFLDTVYIVSPNRIIAPKGPGQKRYIDAIRSNDMVFGIGPAGTGKTYLAMAMSVSYLQKRTFRRIILVRPAVEAGEKLGFLPGSMIEKVNPYLRPLYDALHDMMDPEKAALLIEKGVIEVAPLAFMRGRTLNDSIVILDEAQNTSAEQMKMFLTRLGFNSKAIITGDVTQIDLPNDQKSGLVQVQQILKGIDGIEFCYFSDADVVRHPLVQEVIKAYERFEAKTSSERRRKEEESDENV